MSKISNCELDHQESIRNSIVGLLKSNIVIPLFSLTVLCQSLVQHLLRHCALFSLPSASGSLDPVAISSFAFIFSSSCCSFPWPLGQVLFQHLIRHCALLSLPLASRSETISRIRHYSHPPLRTLFLAFGK